MAGELIRIGLKLLQGLTHVGVELLQVSETLLGDLGDYVEEFTKTEEPKTQEEKAE